MSVLKALSKINFNELFDRGFKTNTRQRESNGLITSNDGFSVVAPIKVMVPSSTACNSASCCDLLKR